MKYFYKVFTLLLVCFTMCSCKEETKQVTRQYELPDDLSSCKVYEMSGNGSLRTLTVVHCPNATTSTTHSCGKNCTATNNVISE